MTDLPHKLVIGDVERESPLLVKFQDFLERNLWSLRAKNDASDLTEAETAAIRGKIDLIKQLQETMRPPQVPNKVVNKTTGAVSFAPIGKTAGGI